MIDERGASWKTLLPYKPGSKVLALGLDIGQLASLARTWATIDYAYVNNRKPISALPAKLLNHLTSLSTESVCSDKFYDIIILGHLAPIDIPEITKMYTSNLADGGVMACIGYSGCCLTSTQLKKLDGIIEEYGVLPHGNPRVIFPLSDCFLRRKGLHFHQPGRWQVRLGILAGSLLSDLGCVTHLKKSTVTIVRKDHEKRGHTLRDWLADRLGLPIQNFVLYCGSNTEQRKITALAITPGKEDLVVKIADTSPGKDALNREAKALQALANMGVAQFRFPKLVMEDKWSGYLIQAQTSLPKGCSRQTHRLSNQHVDLLVALSQLNCRKMVFSETSCCREILKLSAQQKSDIPVPLARISTKIFSPAFQKTSFFCHRTHGDFAPWNMSANTGVLSLWDWEDSVEDGLVYTDIFHFIIRQAILIGPWPGAKKLLKVLSEACTKLQERAFFPCNTDFSMSLQVWLVWEHMRNPNPRLTEIAAQLVSDNG